jgi:hypothetical protein
MVENLSREVHAFHYLRRNRIADTAGSSSPSQEMTMTTTSRFRAPSPAAGMIPWLSNLATRMLARILDMPEPLLQNTGVFVFAHVQAVETSVGKTFCPIRLLRRFRIWLGPPAR